VRRFNFYLYSDFVTESIKMQKNPEVTVRSRGVMEKCTYCVQRISAAKIESEKQDRPVRDGEIQTACQQSCPSQAIVFGNINDKESRVAKLKAEELNYSLLGDLNTRRARRTWRRCAIQIRRCHDICKLVGQDCILQADFQIGLRQRSLHRQRPIENRPAGYNPAPQAQVQAVDHGAHQANRGTLHRRAAARRGH